MVFFVISRYNVDVRFHTENIDTIKMEGELMRNSGKNGRTDV